MNQVAYMKAQGYPWLVSYDDHPRIRELYATAKMQPIYLDYKVKSSRTARELVISNLVIPPPVYAGTPELAQEASAVHRQPSAPTGAECLHQH